MKLKVKTNARTELVDITAKVQEAVRKANIMMKVKRVLLFIRS